MTDFLKNRRLYLSGPIEFGTGENWRVEPTAVFQQRFGLKVFDPYADPKQKWVPKLKSFRDRKDYSGMASIARQFVAKDLSLVDRSDLVVAFLPHKIPTTGTHHEIIFSANAKKPTLLVCPEGKEFVPLWYYGFIKSKYMFGSWHDLYKYLDAVNRGRHKKDRRWWFVCNMI